MMAAVVGCPRPPRPRPLSVQPVVLPAVPMVGLVWKRLGWVDSGGSGSDGELTTPGKRRVPTGDECSVAAAVVPPSADSARGIRRARGGVRAAPNSPALLSAVGALGVAELTSTGVDAVCQDLAGLLPVDRVAVTLAIGPDPAGAGAGRVVVGASDPVGWRRQPLRLVDRQRRLLRPRTGSPAVRRPQRRLLTRPNQHETSPPVGDRRAHPRLDDTRRVSGRTR